MRCPKCQQTVTRRKDDGCPYCGQHLLLWKGNLYRAEDGAPNVAIVSEFEKLVSQKLSSASNTPVPFRIHRKSANYTLQLITAEQLLAESDYDLDLVKRTLHVLYDHHLWQWMTTSWTSLTQLRKVYPGALAVARVAAKMANADATRQQQFAQQLSQKEDIFK
jgi:hypothetical protein